MIKNKYLILLAISGFVIALDQATKIYVHTHFLLGESITVIPNFFDLTYVRNPGAAWGIFSTASETFRNVFFLSIPVIAILFILYLLRDVKDDDKTQTIALSLVAGGALGNYIDRLQFRFVIDFLDFHYKRIYTYPAFNVADSAIVIGIGILLLLMFLDKPAQKENPKKS